MKKKDYEKPTMQVVMLQHQSHLLAGSLTAPENYSNGGDPFSAPAQVDAPDVLLDF